MIRFRLFGIPFEIGLYFWIGSAIFGSNQATGPYAMLALALWIVCTLVSIVVHEMGHALAARYYGARPTVLLHGIGGLTFLNGARLTRGQDILVSLAGPAAGGVLLGLTLLAIRFVKARHFFGDDNELDRFMIASVLLNLRFMNLYWTVFNLLPIHPLDGGQVLREVLGPRRWQITRWLSVVCAALVAVYAGLQGQIFLALFVGSLAVTNYRGDSWNMPGGVQKGNG